MRKRVCAMFILLMMAGQVFASGYNNEVWRALSHGAEFDVHFQVVGTDGKPVSGAECSGWMCLERSRNHGTRYSILSDTNGWVQIKGRCDEWFSVQVRKEGFYQSRIEVKYPIQGIEPAVIDGKWQPYSASRKIVLKEIKCLGRLSVPAVGRPEMREMKIPKFNTWLSFDLEKFDWSAPYGKGGHADVLLRFRNRTTPYYYDYTYCMDVCFTNNPFGGAYAVRKDTSSDMNTVYEANSNAVYKTFFTYVCERTTDHKRTECYLKDDMYLVYRSRTSVDEYGRLKTAHYGMICGPWMSGGRRMRFTDGCFNPVENDCCIEDGYYLREAVKHYHTQR